MAPSRAAPREKPWQLTPSQVRSIVRYNQGVFDRYVRRLSRLPARRATRNRETGHLSWISTFSHIVNVHEAWMLYVIHGRIEELTRRFQDEERHPKTWAGLRRYAKGVFAGIDAWSRSVTASDLVKPVRAPWMPGAYTVSDAVMQTTLEQAHHLGEIIGTMWQDDTQPPEMTWIRLVHPPRRSG